MTRNVLEWLDAAAANAPGKTAFKSAGKCISYRHLSKRSAEIGTFLSRRIQRQQGVLVFMEKSPACICAMLGIVKAGCFYTPLDPLMPKERMSLIVSVLEPSCIICSAKYKDRAKNLADISGGSAKIPVFTEEDIPEKQDSLILLRSRALHLDTDLLYVLFTSGSTGLPKGVAINHRSVIDFINWTTSALPVDKDCVFGNQAPLYFDNSVLDIYTSIRLCACVDLIPPQLFSFSGKLMEYIREAGIDTLFWVPSALSNACKGGVLESSGAKLRNIFFCGEVMHASTLNVWKRAFPDAVYVNMYGPTEITDVCAYYIVDRDFKEGEPLPIGKACENTWIGIIDGEICVGGTCLSPGYYNDPGKTNEVFIQNPLRPQIREIIYRTGDLGGYNDRGELMFLGRKDSQIKRHGYRIELGEVETALSGVEGINKGCCLFDAEKDVIVSFFEGDAEEKDIMRALKKKLPKYMLPDVYIRYAGLPETGNGKIDRVKLRREWDDEHTLS